MINPKELIKTLSIEDLNRTADQYFKSIPDITEQISKPFHSFVEAPESLQSVGHLLAGLRLGKTMTVLDFAAGTCWLSRLLTQLQCQTISCDVSAAALEHGKHLFSEYPVTSNLISKPEFLLFDGHTLNLPSESVDRIICHDGFHHIPNQREVISELARVLKPGGIAGFSEPGRFHSQSPQSQYEMKNYAVLENDIILPEIYAIALEQGFTDMRVKLLSDMEISLENYQDLTNAKLSTELGSAIENNIRSVMTDKTIFFLQKGAFVPDSRSHIGLSHSISTTSISLSTKSGKALHIPLSITNTGTAEWLSQNIHDIGVVRIGTHLYDARGNLLDLDFTRHSLNKAIKPGETFEQEIALEPTEPGHYTLSIDLVSEGICWFETAGSTAIDIELDVS